MSHSKEHSDGRGQKPHKQIPFLLITVHNFPTSKSFKRELKERQTERDGQTEAKTERKTDRERERENEWAENFKQEKVNILVSSPVFHFPSSVKERKNESK